MLGRRRPSDQQEWADGVEQRSADLARDERFGHVQGQRDDARDQQ
ncbi:hypothetical protein [Amycolatopsis orientalis]|nr:hypothetical protein [Amycolatopsis orientalis]